MGDEKPTKTKIEKTIISEKSSFLLSGNLSKDKTSKQLNGLSKSKDKILSSQNPFTTDLFEPEDKLLSKIRFNFHKILKKFKTKKSRKGRKNKRRTHIYNTISGRNIRLKKYKKYQNILAPVKSIFNAIYNGHYDLKNKNLKIDDKDFVGWEKLENESLTLILIMDTSSSIIKFVKSFARIISSLTGYFNQNKDRIGLIALKGYQAKILNHPSHNYRIISRNLKNQKVKGNTPMADGLLKALNMAKLEKIKNPSSKSLVVLLSDCYPEPLTNKYKNIFDEPAYKNTMFAAKLFKLNKIALLIINPNFYHSENQKDKYFPGEKLTDKIVEYSQGNIIKFYGYKEEKISRVMFEKNIEISKQEINTIISGIENSFEKVKI